MKSIKKHQKALGSRKGRKSIKKHRKSIEVVLLSTFKLELKGGKSISEKGEISDSPSGHYYSRLSDLVVIITHDVVSRFYSQSVRSLLLSLASTFCTSTSTPRVRGDPVGIPRGSLRTLGG